MTTKQKIAATKAGPPQVRAARVGGVQAPRQAKRRVRSVRHFRPPRSGEPDLSRTLRAAASRPGKRRHFGIGRLRGAHFQVDGSCRGRLLGENAREAAGPHRHRPRALFHRGRQQDRQRPAHSHRLRARADCHRAQRQSGQCERAEGRAGPPRLDLPDEHRHRSDSAPVCAIARGKQRRRDRRSDFARAGSVFAGVDDQGQADRGARSARVPSAGPGPARRRRDRLLGDVRARSHRRDLRARRGAWRSPHRQRVRA